MELPAGLAPACDEVAARRLTTSVHGSRRGDGANRTRATVVDLGLAGRSVTAPARLQNDSFQLVPTGGFEPPEPAFVALAAFHLPWASVSRARFELALPP